MSLYFIMRYLIDMIYTNLICPIIALVLSNCYLTVQSLFNMHTNNNFSHNRKYKY